MGTGGDRNEGAIYASGQSFPEILEIRKHVYKRKIVWPNAVVILALHLAGIYGWYLFFTASMCLTMIWGCLVAYLSGLAVTMGAHRFFTHRTFKCNGWIRFLLVIGHTIAGQNSLFTWVRDHRQHHKYSDTDGDPHNSSRGFFFSHVGWLMTRKHPEVIEKGKTIDMTDMEMDSFVMFQKKYYILLYIVFSVLYPMLVPVVLWGESLWNAFFVCFVGRYVTILNFTWLVNSAAHYYGNKPFTKDIMASENVWVSMVTMGEGWHNYHHTFPWDYRTAELGQWLNVTTKVIDFLARKGWVWDMKSATPEMIRSRASKRGDGTHYISATFSTGLPDEEN